MLRRYFQAPSTGAAWGLKFWAISIDSLDVVKIEYGKVGTKGSSKVVPFASPEEALRNVDHMIDRKVRKGYVECIDPAVANAALVMHEESRLSLDPPPVYYDVPPLVKAPRFESIDFDLIAPEPISFFAKVHVTGRRTDDLQSEIERLETLLGQIGVKSLNVYVNGPEVATSLVFRDDQMYTSSVATQLSLSQPVAFGNAMLAMAQQVARKKTQLGEIFWPGSDLDIHVNGQTSGHFASTAVSMRIGDSAPPIFKGDLVVLQLDGTVAPAGGQVGMPFGVVAGLSAPAPEDDIVIGPSAWNHDVWKENGNPWPPTALSVTDLGHVGYIGLIGISLREINPPGYSRKAINLQDKDGRVTFDAATSNWGTIVGFAVYGGPKSSTIVFGASILHPADVHTGMVVNIDITNDLKNWQELNAKPPQF